MKSILVNSGYDHAVLMIISLSGWFILLAYLYNRYLDSGMNIVPLALFSGSSVPSHYTLLFLLAPLVGSLLAYAVNKRIVKYRNRYLKEAHTKNLAEDELTMIVNRLILAFFNVSDAKRPWLKGHHMRVQHYCRQLAVELGIDDEELQVLEIAALLHGVGKIGAYDNVLNKVGKLTHKEFSQMKMHPDHAVHFLAPIKKIREILPVIKYHNERIDGHGYPDGIKGHEIPFLSRILCVADAYDAVTSDRLCQTQMDTDDAVCEILGKVGTQFDLQVVEALLKIYKRPGFHLVAEKTVNWEEANTVSELAAFAKPSQAFLRVPQI